MVEGGEGEGGGEVGMVEGGEGEGGGEVGMVEGGMVGGGEEGGVIEWEEGSDTQESDSSAETPLGKRKHEADYCFPTPVRRKILAEDPASAVGFVGDTSHIRSFVNQVNCTSKCSTPGCSGHLKVVQVKAMGLGGAVEVSFQCSGCVARSLTFSTSVVGEISEQPLLSIALQVAFVCAGCTHAHYTKVLGKALGMCSVDEKDFYKTLEIMYPHCKAILDGMCQEVKEEMKAMDPSELGSWERAVTYGDAAWLTRGYHSQNCTFHIRNYMNGAVLYYRHLCQRGKDTVVEEELYQGTSKSAEGYGASMVFEQAKEEGLQIEAHFEDGDSSSPLSLREYYPDTQLMLCGGHAARSHEKQLKNLQNRKCFSDDEKEKHREKYPNIDSAVCRCKKRHAYKAGCGCFSDGFIKQARSNFTAALFSAGTDADKFARTMRCLGEHHARNEHEWEGGHCEFHPLKYCSCGKCDGDEIKCSGKPYKVKNHLYCPFHSLAYQIECEKRASQSDVLVHPILGRGHTNQVEAAHGVFTKFRAKDLNLQRLHYNVSTNLALMQSNMTWLFKKRGPQYHWLLDLFERMRLPILAGMAEVLKLSNCKRAKTLAYRKKKEAKRKRSLSVAKHRGEEQQQRQAWGKKQKLMHSYGPEPLDDILCTPTKTRKGRPRKTLSDTGGEASRAGKRPCRCGSLEHSQTSHRDCPMNDAYESSSRLNEEGGYDSNTSDDTSAKGQWCTCGGERTHSRSCPVNPHNVGKSTGGVSQSIAKLNEEEQQQRQAWGKKRKPCGPEPLDDILCTPTKTRKGRSRKILSDTGGEASRAGKRPCKCGSLEHSRTSHRDCPMNKRNIAAVGSPVITTADSDDEMSGVGDELIELESVGSEEGGTGGASVPRASSPSSDCLDSEGEGIVHCESPKTFAITGAPTSSWRDDAMAFLGTLTDAPVVHVVEGVIPLKCEELSPHIRDSMVPDGNCMYRAISKQVTGSQDNHMALRLAMIQFMQHEEHAVALARKMAVKFGGGGRDDHEKNCLAVAALQGYIRKHHVDRQGTWGNREGTSCHCHHVSTGDTCVQIHYQGGPWLDTYSASIFETLLYAQVWFQDIPISQPFQ